METMAKRESGGVFHLQPAGTIQAVCFGVWGLGYQKGEYKGIPTVALKAIVGFELNKRISSEDDYNGKRYAIYNWYTISLGTKANLFKDLTNWLGRELTEEELKHGYELKELIGENCLLSIVHKQQANGKPTAKISGILALPEGMPAIKPEGKPDLQPWVKKIQDQAITFDEVQAIREKADEMKRQDEEDSQIPF